MDGTVPDHTHVIFCPATPELAVGPIVGDRVTDIEQFCAIARPCIERAIRSQASDSRGERIVTLPQEVLPFVSSGIALATRDPKDYTVQLDPSGQMVACRPRTEALPVKEVKVFVTTIARYCREFQRHVPFNLAPSEEVLRNSTHVVIAIQVIAGPNSTRHTPNPGLFAYQIAHTNLRPANERPTLDQLARDAWAVMHYSRDFSPVYG